jgi:beta-glucosidase
MLLFTLRMETAPQSASVAMRCDGEACGAEVPVALPQGGEFVRYGISLKCLRDRGVDMARVTAPFILRTQGAATYSLAEVRLGTDAERVLPCS